MRHQITFFFLLCSLCNLALADMIDTGKLIKLKGTANSKCVEYFRYKGDLYCSTEQMTTNKPVDPDIDKTEKMDIKFDERPWQPAWNKRDRKSYTIEYIPAGDSIDKWNELITSQYYAGIQNKVSPMELAAQQLKQLQKENYNPLFNIIESNENDLIFEFRIESPLDQAQHEIQRIIKGKDGIYILHYSIKKPDMGSDDRDKWIANLKASTPRNEKPKPVSQ